MGRKRARKEEEEKKEEEEVSEMGLVRRESVREGGWMKCRYGLAATGDRDAGEKKD